MLDTMISINRPRQQMLTQQQRNNKRQRANPQQLAYLRRMFSEDPKPDLKRREIIGHKIDMTPRSVQIWFQNNRAKAKSLERKLGGQNVPSVTTYYSDKISSICLTGSGSPISEHSYTNSKPSLLYGSLPTAGTTSTVNVSPYSINGDDDIYDGEPSSSLAVGHIVDDRTRMPYALSDQNGHDDDLDFLKPAAEFLSGSVGPVGPVDQNCQWIELTAISLLIGQWYQVNALNKDIRGEEYPPRFSVHYSPSSKLVQYLIYGKDSILKISFISADIHVRQLKPDPHVKDIGYLCIQPYSMPKIYTTAKDPRFSGTSCAGLDDVRWVRTNDFTKGAIFNAKSHRITGNYNQLKSNLSYEVDCEQCLDNSEELSTRSSLPASNADHDKFTGKTISAPTNACFFRCSEEFSDDQSWISGIFTDRFTTSNETGIVKDKIDFGVNPTKGCLSIEINKNIDDGIDLNLCDINDAASMQVEVEKKDSYTSKRCCGLGIDLFHDGDTIPISTGITQSVDINANQSSPDASLSTNSDCDPITIFSSPLNLQHSQAPIIQSQNVGGLLQLAHTPSSMVDILSNLGSDYYLKHDELSSS